jgi:hypothetical protein
MQFYKLKPFFEFEDVSDLHYRSYMIQTIYAELSANPYAIDLLSANQEKIDWNNLSGNPNAIELLAKNIDKINWDVLSSNPNAIQILAKHPEKINWNRLAGNPGARSLLTEEVIEKYKNNVYFMNGFLGNPSMAKEIMRLFYESFHGKGWFRNHLWWAMSCNPNPKVINDIYELHNVINWDLLSANPCAIEHLKHAISDMKEGITYRYNYAYSDSYDDDDENPREVDWSALSSNPNAMELISENPEEIDWYNLTRNPSAIDFLQKHLNHIRWKHYNLHENPNAADLLIKHPFIFNSSDYTIIPTTKAIHILDNSYNQTITNDTFTNNHFDRTRQIWRMPSIFEFDYKTFTRYIYYESGLFEELYKNRLHPRNIGKFAGWGFEEFEHYTN